MEINFWELFKNTLPVLWNLWPVWLFVIGILVIKIMLEIVLPQEFEKLKTILRFRRGIQWRSDRDLLRWLRGMSPKEFEEYIASLFSKLGYKTEVTGGAYDEGIDVVAEKDGVKHYIQCKKFITQEVGVGAIRDFYGAIADHLAAGKGYFITTNKFTLEAERFAGDKPIELVDEFKLIKYIRLAEKETKTVVEKTNNCPQCNGDLIEKKGKFGEVINKIKFNEWEYLVIDWKPTDSGIKLQINHKITNPLTNKDKLMYSSKEYDESESDKVIDLFKKKVSQIK